MHKTLIPQVLAVLFVAGIGCHHADDNVWPRQGNRSMAELYGVFGTDANNVYAVGQGGALIKWNGALWSPQPSGVTTSLYDIWGRDANNIWAVGFERTILK